MVVALIVNLAYTAAMASIALAPTTPKVGIQDWLLHAFAFGLQVGLLSLVTRRLFTRLAALGGAAAGALLCGTVFELLQVWIFGCDLEAVDLLANAVGVGLAAALLSLPVVSRRLPAREGLR
jgi:hypothetical protein